MKAQHQTEDVSGSLLQTESLDTTDTLVSSTIPAIRVVDFSFEKKNPPNLLITVMGEASIGPWTLVQLVPRNGLRPGADGFCDFDLHGMRGSAHSFIPFVVAASYYWKDFPIMDRSIKGVRIHGENGGVMAKTFADLDMTVPPSDPQAEVEKRQNARKAHEKQRIPLPSSDALLFRAGEWELYFFFKLKGSKSEGPVGILLRDGSVEPNDLRSLDTELGTLINHLPSSESPAWAPSGWCFADYVPNSKDFE